MILKIPLAPHARFPGGPARALAAPSTSLATAFSGLTQGDGSRAGTCPA
jgi:hypothetical protein